MALREFYSERFADAANADSEELMVMTPIDARHSPSLIQFGIPPRRRPVGVRSEDKWTLEYINLLRIQPLLEAFDDDASTWVTVTEVNSFTQARPRGWRYESSQFCCVASC